MAVAHDLVLHAVILGVHAGGEYQHPFRELGLVDLPPPQKCVRVLGVAPVFPELPKAGVIDHLHLPGVPQGVLVLQTDALPAGPRADKGVQPEGTDAVGIGGGVFGHPLGGLFLHGGLLGHAAAAGADPKHIMHRVSALVIYHRLLRLVADILPLDLVELAAMGALGFPPFHGALGETLGDVAAPPDGGGADLHRLGVVEGCLPRHGQFPGVTLGAGGLRPAVSLIPEHIADGLGGQGMGLVGAAQRQDAAGIGLLEQGVPAVPALRGGDAPAHGGAVPDHGRDAQLGELPGVDGGRMDKEDAAGVLVDDVSDDVVENLRLSHLGRGHKNDMADLRIGESVHDGP